MRLSRTPLALLLLAAALLLAPPRSAHAQTGRASLLVQVVDTLSRPVPGARVRVSGVAAPALSDSSGAALVEGIPLGSWLVTIDRAGYGEERALLQFPVAARFRLPVVLTPQPLALDTLRVTGERFVLALHQSGFYRRRQEGVGKFLSGEAMERIAESSPDLAPVFRQVPGFRVEHESAEIPFVLRSTRGEGSLQGPCTPAIRIDGVRADMQQLATLSPAHVEAVEVYPGTAIVPPEYAEAGATCGMVLVWLKR